MMAATGEFILQPLPDGSIQVDCSVSGPTRSAAGSSCQVQALQARNAEEVESMVRIFSIISRDMHVSPR